MKPLANLSATFPRRELLQKIASAALLFVPRFRIGDLVASDWVDEFDEDVVDFGEVLGLRWLPESHSGFPANSWVYYIYWTHSTCGADSCYPCYDGEPTGAEQLRLVSHD
ncbi:MULTISPECIES: hypothetical protein [unclassified Microcoleus]|uniref:hypothetical protein n=1 Tax=unclassified Microcoleus TaxID=2642155 RepID=UPI002FD5F43B